MPETIITSLRFEGKADDLFNPPQQNFSVSHDHIFSAARLTINGQAEGREHYTYLSIRSPDDTYMNSVSTDVPDREPTTVGASRELSRLPPGDKYSLWMYSLGFSSGSSGEDVSVTIDLLGFDSTVADVTCDVLRDAESDPWVNAIAFGISEASFTNLMTAPFTAPELEVGRGPYLKLTLDLETQYSQPWPFVHIDASTKEFVVSGELLLTFSRKEGPLWPVAVVSATLNVYCQPAMVTATNDTLQIQFLRADVMVNSTLVNIIDESGILGPYKSVSDFREEVNRYLDQIISNTGPLGFALPAYLASRPMPDHWHHVLNMELDFLRFDYRTVKVHGVNISYLFIVFSVRSLNLPPPCYCETEVAALQEANTPSAAFDWLSRQESHKRSLLQHYRPGASTKNAQSSQLQEQNDVVPPRPDYYRVFTPAQIAALGLSQRSFQEIARPYASMGHDESTSTGGSIYVSARFWFRTTLQAAEITSDGMKAVIDVTAEGSARAAVRDKCGHDVLSAGARLRIRCDDTSIRSSLRINETIHDPPDPPELTIEADPQVNVGDINVKFDGVLSPPPPLDQFENWVITTVANMLRPALSKRASEKRIRLIRTLENNGGIRLIFVDDKYLPGEAAVVLGQLIGTTSD